MAARDSTWTCDIIHQAVLSLKSLERLDLRISNYTPAIERLPSLRHCRLRILLPFHQPETVTRQSAEFIARNPQIERLAITTNDRFYMSHQRIDLRALFARCSVHNPMQLKELELAGFGMVIDQSTAPHLRSLRELSLTMPYIHTDPQKHTTTLSLQSLLDADIHVESLSLSYVDMDVLHHIASMNGLTRLTFDFTSQSVYPSRHGGDVSKEAEFFFDRILTQHAVS